MTYDLVKICSKCRIIQLNINFYKAKKYEDDLDSWCKNCCKIYYRLYRHENPERQREYMKRYYQETRDQWRERQREYQNNRRETDPMYKFATNLRSRTRQAFKAQNVRKNNKTMDILGCSHSFFKHWIEFQLFGVMTLENYGKVWHIDHSLPVCSFNLFNGNEMRKFFNWKKLRPMLSKDNLEKGDKIIMRFYLLQEIKANYFLKM